jgi:hypothetical protein
MLSEDSPDLQQSPPHDPRNAFPTLAGLIRWIQTHDESWLFVAMYIGFAVVLSVWLSLFWLVAMVVIHFLLEVIRQSRVHEGWTAVTSMASWEVRVDLALLLLAFAVSLYMDLIMAVLGLQSLGRAAVATSRVGARAVAWQRAVRAVVLGFDDVINGIRAIFLRKGSSEARAPEVAEGAPAESSPAPSSSSTEPQPRFPGWGQRWGFWDRFTMFLSAGCLAAMVLAPPLTESTYRDAARTLLEELRPFPDDGNEPPFPEAAGQGENEDP